MTTSGVCRSDHRRAVLMASWVYLIYFVMNVLFIGGLYEFEFIFAVCTGKAILKMA